MKVSGEVINVLMVKSNKKRSRETLRERKWSREDMLAYMREIFGSVCPRFGYTELTWILRLHSVAD
jgi:hypothetical protein